MHYHLQYIMLGFSWDAPIGRCHHDGYRWPVSNHHALSATTMLTRMYEWHDSRYITALYLPTFNVFFENVRQPVICFWVVLSFRNINAPCADSVRRKGESLCYHLDRLVQERRNSIANALEWRLSCTNPSICCTQGAINFTHIFEKYFIDAEPSYVC